MVYELVAFVVVPLAVMVAATGYALVAAYRLADWRPALFCVPLLLMTVHQGNELLLVAESGSGAVATFGEYPETLANLTTSAAVVLVLRLVSRERSLSDELADRVERERRLRRENERLDEFASIVSHDIRNPLNVAQGYLDLARGERGSDHLDTVADSLDRIETILEGTLELARQGQTATDTEPVPVEELTANCWGMVETGGAELVVDDEFAIVGDPDRLPQLFENLFRNAVEHAGPDPTVRVGPTPDGFYVEDDGPGIPADRREEIFDAGETTDEDGTGFGLAIVESIAGAHGWSVEVTDGRDGGARFEFAGAETHTGDRVAAVSAD